jgi:hypothetical protein
MTLDATRKAEYRAWNTGKSFNRCLDEVYEEEMIQKERYERDMRDMYEAEMQAEHEKYRKWAEDFKQNHDCQKCLFVKHEVDVGVGTIRDCDTVCGWEVEQIISEMEGYGVAPR